METRSFSKNIKIAPRKLRLIARLVKGLPALEAITKLAFLPQIGSRPVIKALNSAVANGKNNVSVDASALVIKNILVDEGQKIKRYSKGRSYRSGMGITRKRSSHLTVILETHGPKN